MGVLVAPHGSLSGRNVNAVRGNTHSRGDLGIDFTKFVHLRRLAELEFFEYTGHCRRRVLRGLLTVAVIGRASSSRS